VFYNMNEGSKPFTMPHFIDWLDRHPRHETYTYTDCENCLNAQYHREFHAAYFPPGLMNLVDFPSDDDSFTAKAEWIAYGGKGGVGERTFGAASDRARLAYTPESMAIA
jgi:hypothetical protein